MMSLPSQTLLVSLCSQVLAIRVAYMATTGVPEVMYLTRPP